MKRRHFPHPLFLCAVFAGALSVQGAGLWLYERGTPDSMTGVAGRAASALEASTAVGNPAGMTRLEKPELILGLQDRKSVV